VHNSAMGQFGCRCHGELTVEKAGAGGGRMHEPEQAAGVTERLGGRSRAALILTQLTSRR